MMNDVTLEFEKIWQDIVAPLVKELRNDYNLRLRYPLRAIKRFVGYYYQRNALLFLNSYMEADAEKIDRHKIAACIVKAILIVRPLSLRLDKGLKVLFRLDKVSETVMLANQYLALSVAITVLDGYIAADDTKELKHRIIVPEPFPEDDSDYLRDVCLDLYHTNAKRINIVTYANVFFLLEKYSCRKVQCDNLENEYVKLLREQKHCDEETIRTIVDSIRFGKAGEHY